MSVPLWVKAMVAVGGVLFVLQLPGFKASLIDAVDKSRAESAFDHADFSKAIALYASLHAKYPEELSFTRKLGFAYYQSGQYPAALQTFDQLVGKTMAKDEVTKIEAAVADMAKKLNLDSK
ncbi:MAG: tetratricopeptide repeat protein [Aquabacterium sp.]|uniref:tetratricopeptide repeat protein n=1 Tax=Aquabacterium sp. TaxID=1872578 RepID=UPI003BE2E2B6